MELRVELGYIECFGMSLRVNIFISRPSNFVNVGRKQLTECPENAESNVAQPTSPSLHRDSVAAITSPVLSGCIV
jgi:hypothetical protein